MSSRSPASAARSLLEAPTLAVARGLIGWRLSHASSEGTTVGRIVETEAYLARDDPASHSHPGRTERNASMFLAAGHAYVYLVYGMHLCFNVVSGPVGVGEAVLVRALEPLEGVALMAARRGRDERRALCDGPAKLVQAMGIGREADGTDLRRGRLQLLPPEPDWRAPPIECGPRVGIRRAAQLPYRFTARGSP